MAEIGQNQSTRFIPHKLYTTPFLSDILWELEAAWLALSKLPDSQAHGPPEHLDTTPHHTDTDTDTDTDRCLRSSRKRLGRIADGASSEGRAARQCTLTTYSVQASLQGNPSPVRTNGRRVKAPFDSVYAQGEGTITYERQRTFYLLGAGQIIQIQH
ncbi:hypothetical protein M430DRAFT_15234 [Amorphotheca resinae ATCC 22711]|uniref:Uncharacterized protein n=1 Tax=Amorphotheca resinae ATCC 22711 TaxID=857342 RepID=A0A2T3BF48_AMORE|nr:hypothetical protein M430DRAFT_15234 [Amorphotheca resinae ATCC 22711]PSS28004.1 hypothetical protein M430DRAFT_15234 [Amorphotheca resinae ATCC 22711]